MGMCACPPVRKKTVVHEREVVDCSGLRGKPLPKLTFHAVLSNLILKDYPYPRAEPCFRLHQRQIVLQPRSGQQVIKWKISEQVQFQMTELQLRESAVQVTLKAEGRMVGGVRINLFLITTGPFHQDFALQFENGRSGRVSFDLKVSQVIALRIECISAQISLLRSHPGEEFSFSIKTIAGHSGNSTESDPSYPAIVLLQNRHQDDQIQGLMLGRSKSQGMGAVNVGLQRRKSQRIKQIEVGGDLRWSEGDLPWLSTTVLSSELHNTYFQVLMWRQQGTEDAAHREFFADSYVSFYKLFGSEPMVVLLESQQYQSRTIFITEKIERYGKECGRGTFCFKILNPPYFRQYHTCVHTESGILRTAPIFNQHHSDGQCPEIQQLLNAGESIEQSVFQLNRLESEEADPAAVRRSKAGIEEELAQVFHLLERSASPQSFLYRYGSAGQLLEGQKVLVQLGLQVAKYLQIEDPTINDICWLILISLLKRTEFSLSLMGLHQAQKRAIESGQSDQALEQKLRIGAIYRVLMHKQLGLALGSLTRKGSEYQRTFAQVFSAYAYFRIPEFRREVLRLITREDDPEISEWRGVEFNLHDDIPESLPADGANVFSELFDWEQHFYKWLPKEEVEEEGGLGETLAQQPWRDRFTRRGLAFFYFLKYWVTYVESVLPGRKEVQWRYFPGYNRLLRGFFAQMKNRPLLQYPDALLDACLKLLVNEKLLNPLVKILLNKVNVYDTSAVRRAIEYLNIILQSFADRRKAIPISFNYGFLFKALRTILLGEFAMGVGAVLVLLYDHFSLFHPDFRRSISMFLLGSVFHRLFLHWSPTVRHVFYHLITYKVYAQAHRHHHAPRDTKAPRRVPVTDADILERYDQLMRRMENEAEQVRQSHLESSLEEHYFRKMKLKAYQRMRRGRMENSSVLNTKAESEDKNSEQQQREEGSHTEIKLLPPRRNPFLSQKHHSSQASLAARIAFNKENHPQDERTKVRPSESDLLEAPLSLFPRIIHQKEFQVPELEAQQSRFIPLYRPRFKEVEAGFLQCLQSEDPRCPAIKIQMFIDNREIRPQKIDEW